MLRQSFLSFSRLIKTQKLKNSAFFEELKKTNTVKRHFSFTFANTSNFLEVERCLKLCGVRYVAHHINGYSNIFIDKLEITY